jgi:hypothetical protein
LASSKRKMHRKPKKRASPRTAPCSPGSCTATTRHLKKSSGNNTPPDAKKSAWESDEEEDEVDDEGEDSEAEAAAEAAADAAVARRKADLQAEFKKCFKRYRQTAAAINWRTLSTALDLGLELPADKPIELMDLWDADMGKVMKHVFMDVDKSPELYGFLPKMAFSSRGSIGSLLASSFCERINSKANQKVTTGNSALDPVEINMVVVLSMNRKFMAFMREHYPEVSGQHFKMTVVTLADNDEGEAGGASEAEASEAEASEGEASEGEMSEDDGE